VEAFNLEKGHTFLRACAVENLKTHDGISCTLAALRSFDVRPSGRRGEVRQRRHAREAPTTIDSRQNVACKRRIAVRQVLEVERSVRDAGFRAHCTFAYFRKSGPRNSVSHMLMRVPCCAAGRPNTLPASRPYRSRTAKRDPLSLVVGPHACKGAAPGDSTFDTVEVCGSNPHGPTVSLR